MTSTLPPVTTQDFDYADAEYARHCLMADAVFSMKAFFASDDELQAMIDEAHAFSGWNDIENKWEVNEISNNEWELHILYGEQTRRQEARETAAALARYTHQPHLTHRPFARLAI